MNGKENTKMSKKISTLVEILKAQDLVVACNKNASDIEVENISDNSKKMSENTLFICKGATFKKEYLEGAFEAGAVVYISQVDYEIDQPAIIVKDVRIAMALAARWFFDCPGDELIKVGFTGTKGKTSSTTIVQEILKNYFDSKIAYFTTHLTSTGAHEYESGLTTPEPITLHSYFREAVDCGCSHVVMEVSSQAMKLNRIYGERYKVGTFLNIDDDHISPIEHADMDEYLGCKVAFFKQCDTVVINRETRFFDKVYAATSENQKVILFGYQGHEYQNPDAVIENVVLTGDGLSFDLSYKGETNTFTSNLMGVFNVDNIVAAILTALELGVPYESIKETVKVLFIPGRFNKFEICGRHVFIDYAHNHLSYENLFSAVRTIYPTEFMTALIGVAGDRFIKRRRDAGEVTDKYADKVFITEQDPADKDVTELSMEVAQYLTKPYQIIPDREEAIRAALSESKQGEVVVLAGKGAEKSQRMAGGYEKPYKGDYRIMKEWEADNSQD
jgi:UDP-N-acetylmuramyl-tripeptide synthetase